jgi:hypothetical protein
VSDGVPRRRSDWLDVSRWPAVARFGALVRAEAAGMQGFMHLLMKPRNGSRWSAEERRELRAYLRRMARALPAVGVFALPGGSLLLPLLALAMDRRKSRAARAAGAERREALAGADDCQPRRNA